MSRDSQDVETGDIPDLETIRNEGVGINSCMITSVLQIIENQVSNGNILQSVSVERGQTGNDGKSKSDCFGMKSIRAKLSRPKIPKIFRKSKGESSVAESQKAAKKSEIPKVMSTEEEEKEGSESVSSLPSPAGPPSVTASCGSEPATPRARVSLNPSEQGESEGQTAVREMERPDRQITAKVQPTLAPSQTTGRVNLS